MIKTGKEPMKVMTFIAILAVCFVINLPGIAVAPIEGKLMRTLGTSELEIQLLTTLPNFVIIPFVFLSGKLSDYRHKMPLIVISLLLFAGCGVGYLFAESMTVLIILSCLLGAADGILIPFAMGFVVNSFEGKYRTRNLGFKSATSNLGTVIASFVVGYLIEGENWHTPFAVYLIVIVPLVLSWWLQYVPGFGKKSVLPAAYQCQEGNVGKDLDSGKIWSLICNNVSVTFITFSIVLYLPQLIEGYNWSPSVSGDVIGVFFIAVLSSGFVLEYFLKGFKSLVFPILGLCLFIGLGLISFFKAEWAMYVESIFAGFAFGIFQPLIYDKTSYAINNPRKNIFGLSLVLTALYIAIAVEPFVITGIVKLFKIHDENHFVFQLSFYLSIAYILISFIFRKKFAFSISPNYYS